MNVYVQRYLPFIDYLAEVLGKDTEIVLHDIKDMDCSVVAIRNNHISGRNVGAPATNLVLKIIKEGKHNNLDFLSNYRGISESGKTLKSSTYFIRNEKHSIVGMLCINIDTEKFVRFKDYLETIIAIPEKVDDSRVVERFSSSVAELAFDSIRNVIGNAGIPSGRMSQEEKIKIVQELYDNGVFLLKGTISEIAKQLATSEATIYRYLNKIKKGK